jgi:hypothetical protein
MCLLQPLLRVVEKVGVFGERNDPNGGEGAKKNKMKIFGNRFFNKI